MIRSLKILSVILLLFNGIGAVGGGLMLIIDSGGNLIQADLSLLKPTVFKDYLFPGILLFVFNGLVSIIFAIIVIRNKKIYPFLIFLQGCILTGWIIIQVMLLQMVYFLHFIMGITGLLIIVFGIILNKKKEDISFSS